MQEAANCIDLERWSDLNSRSLYHFLLNKIYFQYNETVPIRYLQGETQFCHPIFPLVNQAENVNKISKYTEIDIYEDFTFSDLQQLQIWMESPRLASSIFTIPENQVIKFSGDSVWIRSRSLAFCKPRCYHSLQASFS